MTSQPRRSASAWMAVRCASSHRPLPDCHHHADITGLAAFVAAHGLAVVAVDNTLGAVRLETAVLPRACVLVFGQEGPRLTDAARDVATLTVSVARFGSTRSVNAGVAAGIAMHAWIRAHADLSAAW